MNSQANAKASVSRCHPGLQETFDQHDGDHHDGNDDLGPIGGLEYADRAPAVTTPAPLAYPGVEPFDDHLAWGESGQQDHQGANDDSLRIMADRVRARAVRRAGELLKQLNSTRARTDLDLVVVAKPCGHDDRTRCTNALKRSARAQLTNEARRGLSDPPGLVHHAMRIYAG
jgi:hypothetical protein